ncbi:MAG: NPCBM/NEW2 domain-containing protein [Planctomycetes bacterium]|nr:NPCBM/NEW2 domain-containing protein [Planctomycetota bacterium]MCB9916838.1 NPCBM/NEW2 domain-containing protein [Planctomycetota bacterium]
MGYRSRSAIVVCALCALARAQSEFRVTDRAAKEHRIAELRLDGDRLRGESRGSADSGSAWSLPVRDLWTIEPLGMAVGNATASNAESFVQIRKGPRLQGSFVSAQASNEGVTDGAPSPAPGTVLRFDMRFGGETDVPLRHVQAIRFGAKLPEATPSGAETAPTATEPAGDEGFAEACVSPPKNRDLLFAIVGGKLRRLPCRVQRIENDAVIVERGQVEIDKVYGLVLAEISGIEAERRASDRRVIVRLGDRLRLEGELVSLDQTRVGLRLDAGPVLHVPWPSIVDCELESERLVYVSDLELKDGSVAVGALGRVWPLLRDVGPGNRKLAIGNRTYRRGLFAVPPRTMVFELPRRFDRLVGEVGMPAARIGSASLRFLAGNRPLGEPLLLHADGSVHALSIPLGDAERITIELVVGPELDSGSRVVLGDLRLIAD